MTITEKLQERWLEYVEDHDHGIIEEEYLGQKQQADEMLRMGLRLHEGLDVIRYESIAGKPLSHRKTTELRQQGLVEIVGGIRLRVTTKGRIILNYIIGKLAVG